MKLKFNWDIFLNGRTIKMEIKNGYCIWLDFLVVTPVNDWTVCEQINKFDKKYSQYLFSFYGQ